MVKLKIVPNDTQGRGKKSLFKPPSMNVCLMVGVFIGVFKQCE